MEGGSDGEGEVMERGQEGSVNNQNVVHKLTGKWNVN